MREHAGCRAVDDLAIWREQLFDLVPEVQAHREVAVALLLGKEAGARDLKRLRHTVAAGEVHDDRREMDDGPAESHHAHEDVPAGPRHACKLGHRSLGAVDHVAERPAETDRDVECVVAEPRKVGDVPDYGLDIGHAGLQQLELAGGDVERGHVGSEPEHLEREPAGPGSGVEHLVPRADVSLEHPEVGREARSGRPPVLEACPLLLAVLVEELRRARWIPGAHSRSTSCARSLSPRPESPTRINSASRSRARASACAGSSAGRMPSVRARSWNAPSASSSFATRYSARPLSRRKACSGPTPG